MAKVSIEEIVSALSEMTLMEVNDLVKAVEEKFGVSAAAPVAVAGGAAGGAAAAEEAAAPTEVNVILKSPGGNKIAIFKLVKDLTGLGLLEAKKLVESAPVAIKEKISPAEAQELKAKLVEAGAEVEIK